MTKPYYKNEKHDVQIYNADCLKILDELIKDKKKFDCIFADPPYFLSNDGMSVHSGKRVKVNKGEWDRSKGVDSNYEFNFNWLSKCKDLLKDNGTIWISGTFHIIYSIAFAAQKLDMKFLNNIVWQKPNPPPNLSCRYFTHSTETVLWFAKNKKSKHKFNYKYMKGLNNDKQMKDVWTLMAPKKEEKEFGKHPTQKPLLLLEYIIQSSTDKGDLILDPFSGSSTTGVSCIANDRSFIGIDSDLKFCKLSVKRFKKAIKEKSNKLNF